jgi:hypothetical protein
MCTHVITHSKNPIGACTPTWLLTSTLSAEVFAARGAGAKAAADATRAERIASFILRNCIVFVQKNVG